jgi:hypothetical protein
MLDLVAWVYVVAIDWSDWVGFFLKGKAKEALGYKKGKDKWLLAKRKKAYR